MHYRTIFISDVHLGTRGCSADALLNFLKETESDYLYLVGDIVDGWRLKRKIYWPQSHNDVVQKLLRKSRKGTKVTYIPGNHDEVLRDYLGLDFGGIVIKNQVEHLTLDGKLLLVMHGDQFDGIVTYHKWLALVGDWAYGLSIEINRLFSWMRRKVNAKPWSLSEFLKRRVKQAVNFIGNYETAIVQHCKDQGFDGVVCGHIHHAEIKMIDGVLYVNDGDWVESRTAVVEHMDGRLEIIRWDDRKPQ